MNYEIEGMKLTKKENEEINQWLDFLFLKFVLGLFFFVDLPLRFYNKVNSNKWEGLEQWKNKAGKH